MLDARAETARAEDWRACVLIAHLVGKPPREFARWFPALSASLRPSKQQSDEQMLAALEVWAAAG